MGQMTKSKIKAKPKKMDEASQPLGSTISQPLPGQSQKVLDALNAQFPATQSDKEESPKAKTIHVIMRPDNDGTKISEIEKKNIKKQFLNVFQDFPEDEDAFEASKAS